MGQPQSREDGSEPPNNLHRSRSSLSLNTVRDCVRRVRNFFTPNIFRRNFVRSSSSMSENLVSEEGIGSGTDSVGTTRISNGATNIAIEPHEEVIVDPNALDVNVRKALSEVSLISLSDNVDKRSKIDEAILNDDYADYPFLRDELTIRWISKNHVMIVLRGLPGSGKSSLVKHITALYTFVNGEDPVICSADHYFLDVDGNYHFDASKLKEAHEASQESAKTAILESKKLIIIDNTNVMRWEMSAYFQLAERHHSRIYRIILVEPQTPWAFDAKVLALKNSHDVSHEVLVQRIKSYELVPPVYFGWFLSKADSQRLLLESFKILETCFQVAKFWEDFKSFSSMLNIRSALSFYNRDMCLASNSEIVHVTAKFCGRSGPQKSRVKKKQPNQGFSDDVIKYTKSRKVEKSLGKVTRLRIIGFVFTKETFGARVQLSKDQLDIYDQAENDFERNPTKRQYGRPTVSKTNAASLKSLSSKSEDSSFCLTESTFEEKNVFFPIPGRGKRAHVTLGTSEGVRPVNTGIDLLEVVHQEKISFERNQVPDTYDVPETDFKLRRFSSDLWALYPKTHIMIDSIFTGHY